MEVEKEWYPSEVYANVTQYMFKMLFQYLYNM